MLKVSDEFLKKTLQCKTPEELQALAKAEGIELSPEGAKRFLEAANGGLSDDMLDKVAGGAGYRTNCDCLSDKVEGGTRYVTNC